MADYDRHHNILQVQAIPVVEFLNDDPIESGIIDMFCYNAIEFVTNIGACTDTATFTVEITHGNDPALADSEVVPADSLLGTIADAGWVGGPTNNDNGTRTIGYIGKKRYVRYTVTPAGNSLAFYSVVALLGVPAHAPTPTGV
jgi:hypothetical protein